MFLSALDQTVVGTAIRTIGDDLHGLSQQAWVTTAYLIVSTISHADLRQALRHLRTPAAVHLRDRRSSSSARSWRAFSTSMVELAGFRAIQGLGAGGLMSMPLAIMGDMLAPRERAKYQGYFLAVFGVSSVLGPLIGGLFAGADEILWIAGWRWVFLINVPIGIVALGIVLRFLHLPKHPRAAPCASTGGARRPSSSRSCRCCSSPSRVATGAGRARPPIACYVIGVVGIIAFILIEIADEG